MKKKILALIIVGIILAIVANAQFPWQFDDTSEFLKSSDELVQKLIEVAEKYKESYPEMFYKLARRTEFIHFISKKVDSLINIYVENLIPFLMSNPPIENSTLLTFLNFSISLLEPLYIIAILLTATYLLFISGSPRGRAKAKSTFVKLIIGLGIIMLTLPIMQLLLEISHFFSSLAFSLLKPNPEMFKFSVGFFMSYFAITTFFKPVFGSIFLMLSILLPTGVLLILSVRYFLVILLTVVFPFTILFYSFSPTQKIGKTLIFHTFLWIFLPILNALILGISSISFLAFTVPELKIFIPIAAFILLIFSPIIFLGTIRFIISLDAFLIAKEKIERKVSEFV